MARPITLGYAKRSRHSKWWRRAVVLTALLGVAALGYSQRQWIRRTVLERYWLRACMRYTASGEQVTLEGEAFTSVPIVGDGAAVPATPSASYGRRPDCWDRLDRLEGGGSYAGAVLFLHERTAGNGERCLVVVESPKILLPSLDPDDFEVAVVHPGHVLGPARVSRFHTGRDVFISWIGNPPHHRIFQGQPDPNDASHFTIDFDEEDLNDDGTVGHGKCFRRRVIDGWLNSDGTVRLARRP